ncbi:hypothetical protein [Burkholderia mayonis]|uniref:hypothetical protein n=1 Tax=Burkholderia mayonis TaxID=1385591 RepID=UPI000B0A69BC|nr:hypothetical protein [Burkholderia mayonis]
MSRGVRPNADARPDRHGRRFAAFATSTPHADHIDLTPSLADSLNTLMIVGVDWSGPATFKGTVVVGKIGMPASFTAPSTPNGIVFRQAFVIPQ